MSTSYLIDSQFDRGVEFFRKVLEEQPEADSVRLSLGILLKQQNKIVGGDLTAADVAPSVFLADLFHL